MLAGTPYRRGKRHGAAAAAHRGALAPRRR